MNVRESERSSPELRIETVPQAAKAIVGIYGDLKRDAVPYTTEYLLGRFSGEENKTWGNFYHRFLRREQRSAILDSVLAHGEDILIDASFDTWGTEKVVAPYRLRENADGGIVFEQTGWTAESGYRETPRAYVAQSSGVLLEATRVPNVHKNETGMTPVGSIDLKKVKPVLSVSDDLRRMIEQVQTYRSLK
jgi:hypothetical protein